MDDSRHGVPMVGDIEKWYRICDWLQVEEDEVSFWADNDGGIWETQDGRLHKIAEFHEESGLIIWYDEIIMQSFEEEDK